MISTAEYLGGGFAQVLTPPQTFVLATDVRWHYLFVSGAVGAATIKLPVADLLILGFEYTFVIDTDTIATVEFQNGRGEGQPILDKFGGLRTSVSSSTGLFGSRPAVRARLIVNGGGSDDFAGATWTIWSVGDTE